MFHQQCCVFILSFQYVLVAFSCSISHSSYFVPGQGGAYSLCEVCNLQLTSDAQAQLHYNGRSHLRRVRQLQAGETGQHAAGTLQPPLTGVIVVAAAEVFCYYKV